MADRALQAAIYASLQPSGGGNRGGGGGGGGGGRGRGRGTSRAAPVTASVFAGRSRAREHSLPS